jgi:hypothetical protein
VGSAEEEGILQQHDQGCIERLRGLEDFNVPHSAPGVQLAPTSPNLVESECCELRLDGVLRRLMCNELYEQIRQVTQWSAEGVVDPLSAGVCRDLGCQARQQPS